MLAWERRFWSKVDKTATCWLWTASRNSGGYGMFALAGRMQRAHRVAYELLVGPIPEGLDLDHVRDRGCTNRHCVNPAHLEPTTRQENIRRGARGHQPYCARGHAMEGENVYVKQSNGTRMCHSCKLARTRAWRRAQA